MNELERQERDQAQSKAAQEKRQAIIKTIRHRVCEDYPELFNKADPKPLAVAARLHNSTDPLLSVLVGPH